jgi:phosphoglycolate phosphatase-like HAD superfamily hydrolase
MKYDTVFWDFDGTLAARDDAAELVLRDRGLGAR